jgi:hypothetical protein
VDRWEVNLGFIVPWLSELDVDSHEQVMAALAALAVDGPALGRPFADRIRGSAFANMKELRPGSAGASELRVLFAFDPRRRAVMLVGGDKRGQWDEWYRVNIPRADRLFREHLRGLEEGK